MSLGIYISVPFCRSKCSYCNFASGVFSGELYERYAGQVVADIGRAQALASEIGAAFERRVDSIYLGGGTPSALPPPLLERLFAAVRENFDVDPAAEVTVECAPGTLTPPMLETLLRCGVNRVSLGVQSFVDQEVAAVGRLHKRATVLDDIARLRAAGLTNINVDLIAGLPHQTEQSWQESLDQAIATGAPHVSVYMLEVDEDSRLGRELIAGGTRYHAHFVPDEDLTALLYEAACERLDAAGVAQYEISNFARPGFESRHNLKYWTRQPYLGFGVDAHSLLPAGRLAASGVDGVRLRTPDELDDFLARPCDVTPTIELVSPSAALEETFFLGLRQVRGVRLADVVARFGPEGVAQFDDAIAESISESLLTRRDGVLALTPRGRLLSNEVFARFIALPTQH